MDVVWEGVVGVRLTLWADDSQRLLGALSKDELSKANEDSLQFQLALRRASKSPGARGIVQCILDGQRRWWIGSFVESLRRSPWMLNRSDVELVESLLSIVLKGMDCGTPIRSASPSVRECSFPVAPKDNADLRFAVLSPSDFEFLRLFLDERLREEDRRFLRPSGKIGIAPESDDDWDAWVRQVIREIAQTPLLVERPSLVSFLG